MLRDCFLAGYSSEDGEGIEESRNLASMKIVDSTGNFECVVEREQSFSEILLIAKSSVVFKPIDARKSLWAPLEGSPVSRM